MGGRLELLNAPGRGDKSFVASTVDCVLADVEGQVNRVDESICPRSDCDRL